MAACHFDGVVTVWRQTGINKTFLLKSCLETYCSPLPALLCFSYPLPWFWVFFWLNSVVARGPKHSLCRGTLLIIQVMGPREKRANLFAQSCPEASPAGDSQAHISLAIIHLSLMLPFAQSTFLIPITVQPDFIQWICPLHRMEGQLLHWIHRACWILLTLHPPD